MKKVSGILALFLAAGMISCNKDNKMSDTPEIWFFSANPSSVRAGSSEDTLFLTFRIADGDADLGNDPSTGRPDIVLWDHRYTDDSIRFFFPALPDEIKIPGEGIKGLVTVKLPGAFIKPTRHNPDPDTTKMSFFVYDRAGRRSNIEESSSLILVP